jgi:small subunit ribosomal protein S18
MRSTNPSSSFSSPSFAPAGAKDARSGTGTGAAPEKKFYSRRKACRFCTDKVAGISYKDVSMLRNFLTERGKIMPRRISGNCALHQRALTTAIKRARNIAMVAFTEER